MFVCYVFIPSIISFGQTLKFNYLLCVYSYQRMIYIFETATKATKLILLQPFLTLINPILAKWHSSAHSAMYTVGVIEGS